MGGLFLLNCMGGSYYFFQLTPEEKSTTKKSNDKLQILIIAMKAEQSGISDTASV